MAAAAKKTAEKPDGDGSKYGYAPWKIPATEKSDRFKVPDLPQQYHDYSKEPHTKDAPYLQAGTTREEALAPIDLSKVEQNKDYTGWYDWVELTKLNGDSYFKNIRTGEISRKPVNRALSQICGRPMEGETSVDMMNANGPQNYSFGK
jgi:hypothetical protein